MAGEPGEVWTIGRVLGWTSQKLAEKGIDGSRLDAELLLAAALGKDRLYLYTHYDQPLVQAERDAYRALVQRRLRREPVAYILGEREFYGLALEVGPDVLVPRPETEHLVDSVREWLDARGAERPRVLDVGTGSGAIAIAVAVHVPAAEVVAIDVSPAALTVARRNAERHGMAGRIRFLEGDLLGTVAAEAPFDVVAANLPYVPGRDRASLMPEVRDHEPALALFGGDDGLALIRRLVAQAPDRVAPGGLMALEIGAGEWPEVRALVEAGGVWAGVRAVADLQGHPRVVLAERTAAG